MLVSIFTGVNFKSLSGESCNSISLKSPSRILPCFFVWKIFACVFIFLTLCVDACALDKSGMSSSLYKLTSYRRRLPPISWARDSGGLYPLFPHPGRSRQLCFLCACSVLSQWGELWHLPAQATISSLPQAARLWWTHQRVNTDERDASSLERLREVGVLDARNNSSLPHKEVGS